jgi:dihydroxyacetone kinase-like protein
MAAWLTAFAGAVAREKDHLTTLDSAIGDADHGANLDRGAQAVLASVGADPLSTPGAVAKAAGMSLIRTVGGASGPLYGTFFLRFATAAGEEQALDAGGLAAALRAGVEGVDGRDATIPLVARKGRASYLGERSAGHADPGATSAALLMRAAVGTLA